MTLPGLQEYGQSKPEWGRQIDWSHPLCQGLVGAWAFQEVPVTSPSVSAPTIDLTGNANGSYTTTTMGAVPGQSGVAMNLPGGSNSPVITLALNQYTNFSTEWSIASRFLWNGGTPNYNPVMSKWDHAGGIGYGLSLNPTNKLRVDSYNTTGSTVAGNTTISAGVWYDAVASVSIAQMQLFLNGISDATPVSSPVLPGTGGTGPAALIGGDNSAAFSGGGVRAWQGIIEYVYLWQRPLSQEESMSLHMYPYQIFMPSEVEKFFMQPASAFVFQELTGPQMPRKVVLAATPYH